MTRSKLQVPETDTNPVIGTLIYAIRVGMWSSSDFDKIFESLGITLLQFNCLRILRRDVDNAGMPTGMLGRHMLTRVPDVPRLLDRLVKAGLIERLPSPTDRRVVLVRLTQKGIDLADAAMPRLRDQAKKRVAHMTHAELVQLHALLKKLYAGFPLDENDPKRD
jgi:DNA-binding MarR family transcriptional regulator